MMYDGSVRRSGNPFPSEKGAVNECACSSMSLSLDFSPLELYRLTWLTLKMTSMAPPSKLPRRHAAMSPQSAPATTPKTSLVISIIVGGVADEKVKDYADLDGKRIGVTRATVNDSLTTKNAKGAQMVRYEDDATLITSRVTGQIDLFSSTPSNLAEMIKRAPGKNFELKFEQTNFDLGVALNKGEPKLKEWTDKWVQTNLQNGKLNEIYKKYHGRDLPAKLTGK